MKDLSKKCKKKKEKCQIMKNYKENMTDFVAFLYIRMKKIMIK